jgi:hypothetical protein
MKRILTTVAAAAVLAGGLTMTTPDLASADTPRCVSKAEFRQVKKGMSKSRVAGIFDTAGKRDAISSGGGYTFEIRSYKSCTRFGAVAIGFSNGKLDNKTAIW